MRIHWIISSLAQLLVRDHHLLTGLGDNDHPQYLLSTAMTIVRKTADETVNNSAVLQNDDHLLLALAANEKWLVTFYLLQQSVGFNSDFKVGFSYPAGCTIRWGVDRQSATAGTGETWNGSQVANMPVAAPTETDVIALASAIGTQGLRVTAIVINGGNAGNLNLQWAQNTATAEDTKVLTNSLLVAVKAP